MRRRPSPKIFIYGVFATCISAALLCYLFLVKQVEKDVSPQASSLRGLKGAQQRLEHLEHELKANRDLIHSVRQHLALVASKSRGGRDGSSGRNFNLLQSCLTEIPDNRNYEVLSVEDIYDSIPFDNADGGVWKQGWDIQVNASRSKQKLRVFVVPHSHNDPGWLKTFDGYFRGQTRHILDNMLKFMFEHEDMKFIWAETSYFAYWWTTINSEQKEKVKLLLSRGQLEIVTGGWVMNDEANTEIFSMINQLIEGHEWLRNEVNVIPRHGWAIDPFGLSPSMAYLLDQMGFDGMVVQRVHYEVKKYLAKKHLLEFHWLQRWQKDDEKRLLAHVTPFYSYDVPHSCGPDPKVCCQFDFRRLPPFKLTCPWKINPTHITNSNVETRSRKLAEQYWKKAMLFKTNTILVPLGDDFRYEHPKEWEYQYKNYKMLFDFMNSSPDLNIEASFGTLADYFESIKRQSSFPSLTGDFFTYSDRDDHYWSGYYTSRPFYKQYDRVLSSYLRSVEILFSFAYLQQLEVTSSPDTRQKLESIRQNLALFQHHDAITGTAKDVVVNDYAIRMFKSLVYSQELVTNLIKSLLKLDSSSNNNLHFLEIYPDHNSLPAPKIVSVSVGSPANIILFNSLPHKRIELICFETSFNSSSYLVKDSNTGHSLQVQSSFLWDRANIITDRLRHCFEAKLDPLSISSFSIESSINGETPSFSHVSLINFDNFQVPDNEFVQKESSDNNIDGDITLESQRIRLILDDYGHLKRIIHIEDGISHEIKMHFVYYGTKVGKADVKSGAYIFMPDKQSAQDLPFDKPLIRVTKGPLYSKVEIIYQKPIELTQSLIILRHSDSVLVENEFHLTKGSFISNKELVMRLSSQVQSHDLFYTDLNGLQIIRRKRRDKIPIQANVYPVPSLTYLEDDSQRLNVLLGQPLGATSPSNGVLDIFQDRRLLQDDQRGLGQGVTDNRRTKLTFKILFESKPVDDLKASLQSNQELYKLLHPPLVLSSTSPLPVPNNVSFLSKSFPCDMHLLSLRTSWIRNRVFMILHRFGVSCGSGCDDRLPLNVSSVFSSPWLTDRIKTTSVSQVSLSFLHERRTNISIDSMGGELLNVNPLEIEAYALEPKK